MSTVTNCPSKTTRLDTIWKIAGKPLLFLTFLFLFAGCLDHSQRVTRSYNLTGFRSLDISGAYDIEISQSEKWSLTIKDTENALNDLPPKVSGDYLVLDNNNRLIRSIRAGQVTITMPDLKEIDASGSMALDGEGFSGESMKIDGSGSVSVSLKGDGYNRATLDLSGSASVDLSRLPTKNVDVKGSGSTSFKLAMEGGDLDIDLSGSSSLGYRGSASSVTKNLSGASSVRKLD